ncbi:hypothetical protein VN97_g9226 [Penicillium thymicola]|uniref:Uncharacterized protein n=1 Tax=Penicillium thymicola TaxID=293382 RepID=A0AAI9X4Z0_PENTH|nr:hypothetical protein VN97_g9226 [Penicillium thymicola]
MNGLGSLNQRPRFGGKAPPPHRLRQQCHPHAVVHLSLITSLFCLISSPNFLSKSSRGGLHPLTRFIRLSEPRSCQPLPLPSAYPHLITRRSLRRDVWRYNCLEVIFMICNLLVAVES